MKRSKAKEKAIEYLNTKTDDFDNVYKKSAGYNERFIRFHKVKMAIHIALKEQQKEIEKLKKEHERTIMLWGASDNKNVANFIKKYSKLEQKNIKQQKEIEQFKRLVVHYETEIMKQDKRIKELKKICDIYKDDSDLLEVKKLEIDELKKKDKQLFLEFEFIIGFEDYKDRLKKLDELKSKFKESGK